MSYAKISVPQLTFDNMDIVVGKVMHNMTLPFLEFETVNTSHLSTNEMSFKKSLQYFKMETINIMSDFNQEMLHHYKYVVCWVLGRLFGKEVSGCHWLSQVFPKHYEHPNSGNAATKSIIFTQKPLNYSENSNADMIKIMDLLQWQYLQLVGEQCEDKEQYKKDLKLIYSFDADKSAKLKAEKRVKAAVTLAGEMICHGDLLTEVRFESCKRLRRMCVSAVERFDFLRVFRLGTFHLRMNKLL